MITDLFSSIGGLDQKHLCPVEYRTELRETKARVDLPFNRAILDELGFSLDLLLHAVESQLRETGKTPYEYFYLCLKLILATVMFTVLILYSGT